MQDVSIIYEGSRQRGTALEWNPKYYTREALGSYTAQGSLLLELLTSLLGD